MQNCENSRKRKKYKVKKGGKETPEGNVCEREFMSDAILRIWASASVMKH